MEFINCGHRGAMSVAPENTMASFELAATQGANEIEMDLRLSKDGTIVVIHDERVDRTTNGTGAVGDMTYEELRVLDAGDGEQIPAFADVLAKTDVRLQVEIKDVNVIRPLIDLLTEQPAHQDRVSPCSFDEATVAELAGQLPGCVVGQIGRSGSTKIIRGARARGARRVLLRWNGAEESLIPLAHELDLHYNVWPVNSAVQLDDAASLGVDGFTTDYPALLFENGYDIRDGRLAAR